jgi:hypothetical protein
VVLFLQGDSEGHLKLVAVLVL